MSLHDLKQLYIEYEGCKWRYRCTGTAFAVSQTIGDEEAILGSLLHQLQTFRPSGNYLLESENGGFATLYTAVENRTVNEEALDWIEKNKRPTVLERLISAIKEHFFGSQIYYPRRQAQ